MQALHYVQKLHETLSEVLEGGGNRSLFVVLDHDLVARLRAYAFTCLEKKSASAEHAGLGDASRMFVDDLMSRNIFNSRIRYCVTKLQEFPIPHADHFEFVSQAIATYVANNFRRGNLVPRGASERGSSVRDALVLELTNCFEPWYRPDDIFLLDFAVEHSLCSRNPQERRWQIAALGRYLLELPSFETIVTVLAVEVALSRRQQYKFVSRQLLQDLRSSRRERHGWGVPYSLRMFDLVLEERERNPNGINLTPLGERVVDTVLQSEDRLQDLILLMLESEVEGVGASFSPLAETQTQARIDASALLGSDNRESVKRSAALAQNGAYVDALRLLFPVIERMVDDTVARTGYANPVTGMDNKVCFLRSEGILSQDTASFLEIVTAHDKVVYGNISRNDHLLVKPLYELARNFLGRLVQEVEEGAEKLKLKQRGRDPTGLCLAKRYLETGLASAILSAGKDAPLSVVFLDMNGLKAINDTHGHSAGDEAIRAYLEAIVTMFGEHGETYRGEGGDEAVVVLPGVGDERVSKFLEMFARQLGNVTLAFGDARAEVRLTASCGSASSTDPNEVAAMLHDRADKAQYRAKAESRKHTPRVTTIAIGDGEVTSC